MKQLFWFSPTAGQFKKKKKKSQIKAKSKSSGGTLVNERLLLSIQFYQTSDLKKDLM